MENIKKIEYHEDGKLSIVRTNLMNDKNYNPYCGSDTCYYRNARAKFDNFKNQFTCKCGWISKFPNEFINKYKEKWNN